MQKTGVPSLSWEDFLEKGMATHSSILARRIPWTEESGGLQSKGWQRIGYDWATNTFFPTVTVILHLTVLWNCHSVFHSSCAILHFCWYFGRVPSHLFLFLMKTIYISFTPSTSYCARVSLPPRWYLNILFRVLPCHIIKRFILIKLKGLNVGKDDFIYWFVKHFLTPYSRHCTKSVTNSISINSSNTAKELLCLPLWRWQKWGTERLRSLSKTTQWDI